MPTPPFRPAVSPLPDEPESGLDPAPHDTDVLIAGAGIVGLCLGLGLARHGVDVVVAGRIDTHLPGRTVALLNGSIAFLEAMGLWSDLDHDAFRSNRSESMNVIDSNEIEHDVVRKPVPTFQHHALEALSEPLRVMRILDDTGSLFRAPSVSFRAEELGQAWFGRNIRNADLVAGLASAAKQEPRLTLVGRHLDRFVFGADAAIARCEDGAEIRARVVVAADGRRSRAREAAGLRVKSWTYPQTALTAVLRHERPHAGTSTEFHTRQGPFTLVPLPDLAGAPHRSSLVWVMDPRRAERLGAETPARLAAEIERQSRMLLGRIAVEGSTGCFPITGMIADVMTAPRLILAGEAAHVFPPIGAQGLNLGLRDVASLVALLAAAKRQGADLGTPELLRRYADGRRGDVALRTIGVDGLNRSLLSGLLPVDLMRGAALTALAHVAPIRRLAMRAGLGA